MSSRGSGAGLGLGAGALVVRSWVFGLPFAMSAQLGVPELVGFVVICPRAKFASNVVGHRKGHNKVSRSVFRSNMIIWPY